MRRELLTSIRSHSTIRFIALPFFLSALALLVKTFYDDGHVPRLSVALAALLLSFIACIVEIVLSRNLIAWWKAFPIETAPSGSAWWALSAHRNDRALTWVRWALFASYPISLAFWVDQLLYAGLRCLFPSRLGALSYLPTAIALALGAGIVFVAHRVWSTVKVNGTTA